MTLKNAALLALLGMILVTALLLTDLIVYALGVLRGVVAAMTLLTSFVYAIATASLALFFYVFHKAQS